MAKKNTKNKKTQAPLSKRQCQYILNCEPSSQQQDDWTYEDAVQSGDINRSRNLPPEVDLRTRWWKVDDQGRTGACVGYAVAYGVLRWHYVKENLMSKRDQPSARFIWMANKETDEIDRYPTTFLETQGTQTKYALAIAKKYGCVPDELLPMDGKLSPLAPRVFYTKAARFRIRNFHNLGRDLSNWKRWLAFSGPILTRLDVDDTWMNATSTHGRLRDFDSNSRRGGHAVCIVGYTGEHFIIRNSWGTDWGKQGFAFASYDYAAEAFTETYGAVM